MGKRDRKSKRPLVVIDEDTARDLAGIAKRALSMNDKPVQGKSGVWKITLAFDEDDARALERHAKRLGLSVDTILSTAMELCSRDVLGGPLEPTVVEKLARRGVSILGKRDFN